MMGRLYGGDASRFEVVDFPVAMDPVSPMSSIVMGFELSVWTSPACNKITALSLRKYVQRIDSEL